MAIAEKVAAHAFSSKTECRVMRDAYVSYWLWGSNGLCSTDEPMDIPHSLFMVLIDISISELWVLPLRDVGEENKVKLFVKMQCHENKLYHEQRVRDIHWFIC